MKFEQLQKKIILVVIGIVLFYTLFVMYSDFSKIEEVFREINFINIIPILCIITGTMFLRSLIQRMILNFLGIRISIKQNYFLFLTGLSMIITPAGTGQIIKSYFLKEKYNYPISKSGPLVLVERFLDFFAIVIIIWISLFFYYSYETFVITLVSTVLLIGIISVVKNKKIFTKFFSVVSKIPFLSKKISNESDFTQSLSKITNFNFLLKPLFFTLCITMIEGFAIYLGFLTFYVDVSYFQSIQLFYTSVILGTFSFLPGGVGVTEGSFVALLLKNNIELAIATSLIIFLRLTTIWYATIFGYVAMYFSMRKK